MPVDIERESETVFGTLVARHFRDLLPSLVMQCVNNQRRSKLRYPEALNFQTASILLTVKPSSPRLQR